MKKRQEYVSGSINGALRLRRYTDVVPAGELLGHVDERLDHESASSEHVGIPHGLPAGADVAVALPKFALTTAQPSQECEVQPEIEGGVSVSESQVQKVLHLAIEVENFARITVRREFRGLGRDRHR